MKKIELKLDRETLTRNAVKLAVGAVGSTLLGALYKADQIVKARVDAHFENEDADQDQPEPITD